MRERLIALIGSTKYGKGSLVGQNFQAEFLGKIADNLIANGVVVQKHGHWEEVVETKDNTACGDGVQIKHKQCSCCKQPMGFVETTFCPSCGAIMDGRMRNNEQQGLSG